MKRIFKRISEGLGETRRGWEGWEGWELWEWWGASRTGRVWNSPRLTYSAIADNPEGGQAGKGM